MATTAAAAIRGHDGVCCRLFQPVRRARLNAQRDGNSTKVVQIYGSCSHAVPYTRRTLQGDSPRSGKFDRQNIAVSCACADATLSVNPPSRKHPAAANLFSEAEGGRPSAAATASSSFDPSDSGEVYTIAVSSIASALAVSKRWTGFGLWVVSSDPPSARSSSAALISQDEHALDESIRCVRRFTRNARNEAPTVYAR